MKVLEIGRICVKSRGREAGRKCVIVDIVDENSVLVTGPKSLTGVRRRKVNIRHIEPTEKRVSVQKGASDEEVLMAIKDSGLEGFMREKALVAQ
ncbi:MAG: 50S ribosomal protein L14e [Acidilobaceae archaeon]